MSLGSIEFDGTEIRDGGCSYVTYARGAFVEEVVDMFAEVVIVIMIWLGLVWLMLMFVCDLGVESCEEEGRERAEENLHSNGRGVTTNIV